MRVAMVHNEYLQPGGEEQVVRMTAACLRAMGVDVHLYLVRSCDFPWHSLPDKLLQVFGWRWNPFARRLLRRIRADRPDIVHVHNVYPLLTPAIYRQISRMGVPIVQTLHNARFLCPSGLQVRDGAVCSLCMRKDNLPVGSTGDSVSTDKMHGTLSMGGRWPAVRHACVHGSRLASFWYARMLRYGENSGAFASIDAFLSPSLDLAARMREAGYPASLLHVIPHPVGETETTADDVSLDRIPGIPCEKETEAGDASQDRMPDTPYVLYLGRLSPEKGVEVCLDAWTGRHLPDSGWPDSGRSASGWPASGWPGSSRPEGSRPEGSRPEGSRPGMGPPCGLVLAGRGPLEPLVVETLRSNPDVPIRHVGWLDGGRKQKWIQKAVAVVVPSLCREAYGLTVAEARQQGTPALVSDSGALCELVTDGLNGFHFQTGNPEALRQVVLRLLSLSESERIAMRKAAREAYERENVPAKVLAQHLAVYHEVMGKTRHLAVCHEVMGKNGESV